jgi:DNA polymerase-1
MAKPDCAQCPLRKTHSQVPPYGPTQTNIAFLGEAPGATEVRMQQPFVGESGQLLRKAITAYGHNPEDFYYTNACKCKLPPDKAGLAQASKCCAVTLEEEFREHDVITVVALGNTALHSLGLPSTGISKMHGRAIQWHGFNVVPILHPASLLRQPDGWNDFAEDLEAVLTGALVNKPEPLTQDNYAVIEDVDQAVAFIEKLHRNKQMIYFDIETSSRQVVDTKLLCCAFATDPDYAVVLPDTVLYNSQVIRELQRLCLDSTTQWCGHNAQFDIIRIRTNLHVRPILTEDTMLAHYALDERIGVQGLKWLAMHCLHVDDWEADIKGYLTKENSSYAAIPKSVLWRYNAFDVIYGMRLFNVFRPRVAQEEDLERLYTRLLIPGSNALVDLAVKGVRIDTQLLYDLRDETEDNILDLQQELRDMSQTPDFNPESPKQVEHAMYAVLKAPPFSQSKPLPTEQAYANSIPAGRSDYTTAKDQVERLAAGNYKASAFAKKLLEYRHARQMVKTYLRNLIPESYGRIHPGINLIGTVTGRMSGSQPNVMNLPSDGPIRGLVVAEPGNTLISIDYKASELRVMGALAQSKSLLTIFAEGKDIHDTLGVEIYKDKYDRAKHRVGVKRVDFGIAYGRGDKSIAEALSVSDAEAKRIRKLVVSILGVGDWMEQQCQQVLKNGYIGTPTGRRRRFPLLLDSNWAEVKRQAINAPIQATSSDLCLLSLININKWIRSLGGTILFPTHDSILLEVPIELADDIASRASAEMLAAGKAIFGEAFTAEVDVSIGTSYSKHMTEWKEDDDDDKGEW